MADDTLFGDAAAPPKVGRSIAGVHQPRAQTHDWITPKHIIDALGPFDLDPCQCHTQPWPCATRGIVLPEDGLSAEWTGRVWCNPPYNTHAAAWLAKMARHGNGTALIFARTETEMFFRHVWEKATAVLFLEGRLHFHYPDGKRAPHNSGGPSCLVAYGEYDAERLRYSGLAGQFVRLRNGEWPADLPNLDAVCALGYDLEDNALASDGRITFGHDDDLSREIVFLVAGVLGFKMATDALFCLDGAAWRCEFEPGGADCSGHFLHVMKTEDK